MTTDGGVEREMEGGGARGKGKEALLYDGLQRYRKELKAENRKTKTREKRFFVCALTVWC
jgi:hypothetical protein